VKAPSRCVRGTCHAADEKSSQVQALQMMKSKRDYGSYDPATAKAAASRGAPSQRPAPVTARAPAPRKTRTPADRRPRQA